jgi:hypothetical protein
MTMMTVMMMMIMMMTVMTMMTVMMIITIFTLASSDHHYPTARLLVATATHRRDRFPSWMVARVDEVPMMMMTMMRSLSER